MKAAIGLLLMLVRVSLGVETFCDGRQNKAQCYGALGGTVVIQLMDNVLENQRFTWSDPKNQTVRWRSNGAVTNNANNTSEIISNNKAVRMKNLSRTDDGEYKFEIHEDGVRTSLRTLQLNIQAPVSSVQVKSECLSQGAKRMSCSSEGDSPQFSWTLDGDTLTDDQLLSGNNETNEITLKATVSGELVCTVSNHVNNASATGVIPTCGYIFIECQLSNGTNITQWVFEANNTLCNDPTTATTITTTPTITSEIVGKKSDITVSNNPSTIFTSSNQTPSSTHQWYFQTQYLIILGSVLSLLLIVLMVTVSLFCVHKRRESSKTQGGNDQELQYADVELRQRLDRDVQPKAKMGGYGQIMFPDQNDKPIAGHSGAQGAEQVEYGQIKFAEQPPQKNRRMGPDGAPQGAEQVEYGQIKFVERPQQKKRQTGANGGPQESEQVEYGQIKFAERPQQKTRQMGHDGAPQGSEQVEYGQIKFK